MASAGPCREDRAASVDGQPRLAPWSRSGARTRESDGRVETTPPTGGARRERERPRTAYIAVPTVILDRCPYRRRRAKRTWRGLP
jgi:hypothetical protein